MTDASEIARSLRGHLHDPATSFSIGSFGAIAEFHREPAEPVILDDPARLTLTTGRGAIRIAVVPGVIPLAYEALSRRPGCWQQGVVFCLPKELAASQARTVLTELGPDRDAIRERDRGAILFDMGLHARNTDFCIRTGDSELLEVLRRCAGRPVLEAGNSAMGAILEASPHRIAVSKLGRIEVYQAIGRDRTPEGPHTHVLPKFLKSGRTHSANVPVPRGFLPCLNLHPANPLLDAPGRERRFDFKDFACFQSLLDCWGLPEYRKEKARVLEAVAEDAVPASYRAPKTRVGRTALRVALRQALLAGCDDGRLSAWCDFFDAPGNRRRSI